MTALNTYKGDSWGKKLARVTMWRALLRGHSGPIARILVLGGEGGDIRCLRALGIDESRIVAAERDRDTADLLRTRFPHTTVVHGDVVEVAKDTRFDAAHLDWCGNICASNLAANAAVMMRVRPQGSLAITMMCGREKATAWTGIAANTVVPKAKRGPPQRRIDCAVRGMKPVYASRCIVLQESLVGFTRMARLHYAVGYHSRTENGVGVPMFGGVFHVMKTIARTGASFLAGVIDFDGTPLTLKQEVRRRCVEHASTSTDAADLYNIGSGTVAAWRAHATMGTYDTEASSER